MNILLASHFFHPSVGGTEQVGRVLAEEFTTAGHSVRVITRTAENDGCRLPFEVYRRPSPVALLRLVHWCDVFFHNNISLRTAWPLLFIQRPWVVAHHTWILRVTGDRGWRDRFKQFVTRKARNIAVSRAVGAHISAPTTIIANPYNDQCFRHDVTAVRDRELVFVGRLIWDKGVDQLLDALAILRNEGLKPRLTIVGHGPEESRLRAQATRLGLDGQVIFAGMQRDGDLAALLNRHLLLVVSSRCLETFGLVALEGVACGCIVIGADCGGLPDAIGPCGVTFPPGDINGMARRLRELLAPEAKLESFRAAAPAHLARHAARAVAAQYLEVFEEAVRR